MIIDFVWDMEFEGSGLFQENQDEPKEKHGKHVDKINNSRKHCEISPN